MKICRVLAFALLAFLALYPLGWHGTAHAQTAESTRWGAFTEAELGIMALTGAAGADSGMGFGIRAAQGVRYRRFAMSLGFGSTFYLTNQEAPPLHRGFRYFEVAMRAGAFARVGPLVLTPTMEYALLQFRDNPLVRVLGDRRSNHAVGLVVGVRLPVTRTLYGQLSPYSRVVVTTETPTVELGLRLGIGFAASIRNRELQPSAP